MILQASDQSTTALTVGTLKVLGDVSGEAMDFIKTKLETTRGATQVLSGDMKKFITDMISDGLISPTEKKEIKRELSSIQTEYPLIISNAEEAGVPPESLPLLQYTIDYQGLYAYLYSELHVFDDMTEFTILLDREAFIAAFDQYYASREQIQKVTIDGLILTVNEKIDQAIEDLEGQVENVRNGDLIDGAIARAKLSADVVNELGTLVTELFPYGMTRQSSIELIKPRADMESDAVNYLFTLVNSNEELLVLRENEIKISVAKAEADRSRIASLEINLDSITSTVAELIPLADGQIANLSQINQTVQAIELLVSSGQYDSVLGLVDSYTLAQAKLLKDRFEVFIGGTGNDYDSAEWILKQDEISAMVQQVIETDEGVTAKISQIVQQDDTIRFTVQDLRSETIERIDSALIEAQAGILITTQAIQLGIQNLETEMQSLISVESDKIKLLTQDLKNQEAALLLVKADSISALVRGGGAEASLSLSVTLPTTIDAPARNAMISSVGAAAVDAVYAFSSGGFWYIRGDSTIFAQKTLKTALRTAGLLGSQITLDADEILMGGKVRMAHLDIDDINAAGTIVVGAGQMPTIIEDGKIITELINVDDLVAKKMRIDSDPASAVDFEAYFDEVNGLLIKKAGKILLSIAPSGVASFSGDSFSVGPLFVSVNAPAIYTGTFSAATGIVDFHSLLLANSGMWDNSMVACTGNAFGSPISFIKFTTTVTTVEKRISTDSCYPGEWNEWEWSYYYADVTAQKTVITLSFYDSNQNLIGSSITGYLTTQFSGVAKTLRYTTSSSGWEHDAAFHNGQTVTSPAEISNTPLNTTGSVSLGALTDTFQISNLPGGSGGLSAGTVYRDANGFLKIA